MKLKVFFVLVATFLSVLFHGYLMLDYYPLKLGFSSGQSICKLSEKFDCQAVSASSFSTFLGIPLSVWGLSTNFILFLMVLIAWWRWTSDSERLFRFGFYLGCVVLGASIVMATISFTKMTVYCLFCLILYGLSLVTFEALRRLPQRLTIANLRQDLLAITGDAKWLSFFFLAIPAFAFFTDKTMLSQYGADELQKVIESSVFDWTQAPAQNFTTPPLLVFGPGRDHATMVITEFADFRCSHCRAAAPALDAFKKSHSDVRLEFYAFPLDSECNKEMSQGNGVSCLLAKAALCAEIKNQGWQLHQAVFDHFEEFVQVTNKEAAAAQLQPLVTNLNLSWPDFSSCLNNNSSHERIAQMANTGVQVGVEGTPTLFVNNKKLSRGQLLPVLESVYSRLQGQPTH